MKKLYFLFILSIVFVCNQKSLLAQGYTGEMAGKGAGEGALIGAIAGALFGEGDAFDNAVEGALIGGGVGALSGALAGGRMDRQAQAEFNALVKAFGEDNLRGYIELMQCKHDKAIALFRVGAVSGVPDHQLASIWLEAIAEKDRRNKEEAQKLYKKIIEQDKDIDDEQQASISVDQYVLTLRGDRAANQLPSCN